MCQAAVSAWTSCARISRRSTAASKSARVGVEAPPSPSDCHLPTWQSAAEMRCSYAARHDSRGLTDGRSSNIELAVQQPLPHGMRFEGRVKQRLPEPRARTALVTQAQCELTAQIPDPQLLLD